ncbi:hypothetical protein TWF788_010498 [Orbilia oligospora]|uniref:Uncharacterized protein n=1 Tax=Orbilia oligospora TaxID=2813651 RepID=A0A7C8U0F7_ORBOL|nr:hypothetical protein TWF788_010498 [Orbilia oligospora]
MDLGFYSHITRWFFIIVCYHAYTIRADDGDEFSNNLFSDLAPLLALFGEQVAKQYLSQSLSWFDCVIFAMAPLGIITAIVSAIRVAGPAWLKAAIGRAREIERDAELEVLSSTSDDVCELWNGKRVVRLFGQPKFTEIFWLEKVDSDSQVGISKEEASPSSMDPRVIFHWLRARVQSRIKNLIRIETSLGLKRFGIPRLKRWFMRPENPKLTAQKDLVGTVFSAGEAQKNGFIYRYQPWYSEAKTASHDEDVERSESIVAPIPEPSPFAPNISLNLLGDPTSKVELALVALITTILQLGVVAFQIAVTYLTPLNQGFTKEGNPPPSYACPLNVVGTFLVMMGMFICAMVVQWKSTERIWYFNDIEIDSQHFRLRLAWIQHNQVIADQKFDCYCLYHPEKRRKVVYSNLNNDFRTQNFWTILGSFVSIVGFILQFTGLRGMNYLASLVQLGAIAIATALRVMIRRPISDKPEIEMIPDADELTSVAKILTRCPRWEIRNLIDTSHNSMEEFEVGCITFDVVRRLYEISGWSQKNTSIKKDTDSVVRAIEKVAGYLYHSDIQLNHKAQNSSTFEFIFPIAHSSTGGPGGSKNSAIRIRMRRETPYIADLSPSNDRADWKIDRQGIEAVLALWAFIDGERGNERRIDGRNLILLGPSSEFNILDYEMFISHDTPCLKLENGLHSLDLINPELRSGRDRVFGFVGRNEAEEHLAFETSTNLPDLRAKHILTCCLNQLFQNIKDFKGQTTWFRGTASSSSSKAGIDIPTSTPILQMGNIHLDGLIDILHDSGINGTRRELLAGLVPSLQMNGGLLKISDAFLKVVQDANVAESKNSQPHVSMEEVFHAFLHAVRTFRRNHQWFYVGDILFGHLRVCRGVFGDPDKQKWTKLVYSLVSQICCSIEAQIYYEIEFRDGSGYGDDFWSKVCSDLLLRCSEVFGDHSIESKRLFTLWTLVSSPGSSTVSRNSTRTQAAAIELPLNEMSLPTEGRTTIISSPIHHITPNKHHVCPGILHELARAEHLKGPFSNIKSNIELVSHVLIDAAGLGHLRIVATCATELLEALSRSTLSIESFKSTISEAASASVSNKNCAVIDILLSVLAGNKASALDQLTARSKPHYLQRLFETSLEIACHEGATEIVHLLLSSGIDPNISKNVESLPLYLAAAGGFTDVVALVVYYGAKLAREGPEGLDGGYNFLHHAAKHGAEAIIDFVVSPTLNIQWRLWLLFARDGNGQFPLDIAIVEGHERFAIRIFEVMVEQRQWHHWDPKSDTGRTHGRSLLHLACIHDLPELAKILIDHGLQPRVVDEKNYSAFQIAAVFGSCEVGKVLLEHDKRQAISQHADVPSMLLAASSDQVNYVKLLLKNGAEIEARDPITGYTALLAAAIEGKVKTVKLLLKRGANILAEDYRGRTFGQLVMISGISECLDIIFNNKDYPGAKKLLSPTLLLTAITSENSFDNIWWIFEQLRKDGKTLSSLLPVGGDARNSFRILTHSFMVSRMHDTEKTLTNFYFKPYIEEENKLLPKAPVDVTWGFSKRSVEELDYHFDRLLWLLDDPSDAATVSDTHGNTALVYAAGTGSKLACKKILQYVREHMEPDLLKIQLEKALHMALYGGRAGIVKILIDALIDAGVDPNEPLQMANFHLTPLSLLLRIAVVTRKKSRWEIPLNDDSDTGPWENDFDLLECVDLFLKPGMETTPTLKELEKEESLLHLAIMCESPEVLEKLVAAGVDINLSLQAQRPLLHFALSFEAADPNWILVLRKHGIDIKAIDKDGKTALIIEIEKSKASTTNILIDNGATWGRGENIKAPELIEAIKFGGSSLFLLLCRRHKKVMSKEEYQNYINTPGAYGSRPVHVAARHHNDKILESLWLEGVDMHAKDKRGCNALSYALESRSTMQLLVKLCRINPNERLTEKEYTAAHIAVRTIQDPAQIAKTLQDLWNLGADFNIKDKIGKTPADYAGFASRRLKFQIRSVVLPSKSSKVEWEENVELCRQVGEAFDKYRLGSGGYSVKERPTIVCRSDLIIPVD